MGKGNISAKDYLKREAKARFPEKEKYDKELSGLLIGLLVAILLLSVLQ